MESSIKNRYDFVILFDVENGNPNGDPDAGNMPRIDQETGHGLVTDVCLKRKIRNYVDTAYGEKPGYRIYVKENVPLERTNNEALTYLGVKADKIKDAKKADADLDIKIRDFMCQNFFDIRTFGAVMTTFTKASLNCGQVRGPVQISFAKSIDPITIQEVSISRVTVSSEKEAAEDKFTMLGNKYIVPYALYRAEGFISANLAKKTTGFSDEDLQILWEALLNMFEVDHSAARGKMSVRKLIVFEHKSALGTAPSYQLFERVAVCRKNPDKPARHYSDYSVTIDKNNLPVGIDCLELR